MSALELNGAAVLSAIAASPATFGMSEAEVNALAMARLLIRLKDRALTLEQLRALAQAIGADDVRLALDHLAGKDIGVLVKRLDPNNPDLRGSDEAWQRDRLVALTEGAAPATATIRSARSARVSPPNRQSEATAPNKTGAKTGAVMKSKALKARPQKDGT